MKRHIHQWIATVLIVAIAATLVACGNVGRYEVKVMDGAYGTVHTVRRADEGELVTVRTSSATGYDVRSLYVNGEPIDGDSFVMPASDVTVTVSYVRMNGAYTVTVDESGYGETLADLLTANEGDEVTLTTFSAYASKVRRYLVNGEPIEGNTFTMPASNVTVTTEYDTLIPPTQISLKVVTSYQQATSYWYASYDEEGITVRAVVDDNVVFTSSKTIKDIGYKDNVEFTVGYGVSNDLSSKHFNVLVTGSGEYWFRQFGSSWQAANTSGVRIDCERCDVFTHGFNGYIATVTIPYGRFGVTREQALGNMTLGVSMRNTLNALKTNWGSFSGLDSQWGNGKKHVVINEDGTFAPNVSPSEYLLVGDGLLGAVSGALGTLGSVGNNIKEERTIAEWTEEVGVIAAYRPDHVVFSAGAHELMTRSVLSTFGDFRLFVEAFRETLPEAELVVVSAIPTVATGYDPEKTVAFNSMVEAYVDTMPNVSFIDLCSYLYADGTVNESMYYSATTLYDYGNNLLSRELLKHFDRYLAPLEGTVWGSNGAYLMTPGWTESGESLTLNVGGAHFAFLKDFYGTDFDLTVTMSVTGAVHNGDAYPKFGIVVNGMEVSRYYFVYADGLIANTAGEVTRPYTGYAWDKASVIAVEGMKYVSPSAVTLRLVKQGTAVTFTVNGEEIYSGDEAYFGDDPVVLGLFSFNLSLRVTDWQLITPTAQEVA